MQIEDELKNETDTLEVSEHKIFMMIHEDDLNDFFNEVQNGKSNFYDFFSVF